MELQEKLNNNLVVLPGAPTELQLLNPSVDFILGNNKTLRTLARMDLHGLVVSKRLPLNSHAENPDSVKISHGCMFIPAPNLDQVLILKNVSDLSKDEAVDHVSFSIFDQLKTLDNIVEDLSGNSVQNSVKARVQLFVTYPSKLSKTTQLADLKTLINTKLNVEKICSNLEMFVNFVDEKGLETKIRQSLKKKFQGTEVLQKLISFCVNSMKREEIYKLSTKNVNLPAAEIVTFGHIEQMIQLFDFYFPNRKQKFAMIPEFNELEDNMLYTYTQEGELGKFCDYASYLGEVRLFSERFLSVHRNIAGIFIKNFSSEQLKSILSPESPMPQQFEIDWLYLGSQQVVAFEIGISENFEQPTAAIRNKIVQCLEKTIPQMQLILYALWNSYNENSNSILPDSFSESVGSYFKTVIFLPGMRYQVFSREIELRLKTVPDANLLSTLLRNKEQVLKCMLFLVETEDSDHPMKLFHLNESLDVVESDQTVCNMFESTVSTEEKLHSYIYSLLSLSSLKFFTSFGAIISDKKVLDVDTRYSRYQEKWIEKNQKSSGIVAQNQIGLNLILSPQQHRILHQVVKTHLVITGQYGSGKTTLLLAKCEQLASLEDIDEIFFIYSKKKTFFETYLKSFSENICSYAAKLKIKFAAVDNEYLEKDISEIMESLREVDFSDISFQFEIVITGI